LVIYDFGKVEKSRKSVEVKNIGKMTNKETKTGQRTDVVVLGQKYRALERLTKKTYDAVF